MNGTKRFAATPLGLLAAGIAILGTGAIAATALAFPPHVAGVVLLALCLRLGAIAAATGEPEGGEAPAPEPVPGAAEQLGVAAR